MMEENGIAKEKKIDTGRLVLFFLLLLIGVLSFYLVAQNTDLIYKKVKDANITIKVPFSFEVFSNSVSEYENDSYIQYYYIHKDYGLEKEQVLDLLLNDQLFDKGEYSEIYSTELNGYEAVQYNYLHLDHSPKLSGFFYTEGLVTLIELENRFLVIDIFKKIDLETGKAMKLEKIQLDLYNEILDTLKIRDNTMNMEEPEDIQVSFGDLDFVLPGYWIESGLSNKVNIHFFNKEFFNVGLAGHAIQETENLETELYIYAKENADKLDYVDYIGEYKLDGELFTVFIIEDEYIVALSDRYWFRIELFSEGRKYMTNEKTQQALIGILFE